jgi:hypothetical protein
MKTVKYKKTIKPIRAKYKGEYYMIKKSSLPLAVRGYQVRLFKNKLHDLEIEGNHPNAEPVTHSFCLPKSLYFKEWNDNLRKMIEFQMAFYNLDDCYFNAEQLMGECLFVEKMNTRGLHTP